MRVRLATPSSVLRTPSPPIPVDHMSSPHRGRRPLIVTALFVPNSIEGAVRVVTTGRPAGTLQRRSRITSGGDFPRRPRMRDGCRRPLSEEPGGPVRAQDNRVLETGRSVLWEDRRSEESSAGPRAAGIQARSDPETRSWLDPQLVNC